MEEQLEQTKPKRVFSEETRKKLSMAKLKNPVKYWLGKNRVFTPEHKENIRKAMVGKKLTPEHIKNIVASRIRNRQAKLNQEQNIINNQ